MHVELRVLIVLLLDFKFSRGLTTNPNPVDPVRACPCEYRFDPICGSNNITYFNKCVLDCNNDADISNGYRPVLEQNKGDCRNGQCICQNIDLPVCTLDGEIYPNECELYCENVDRIDYNVPILYLAFRAICNGDPCGCTDIAAPVCGTNNILYRNRCVLDCASHHARQLNLPEIGFKNNGACLDQCLCPIEQDPVCGSDGKMYDNICKLECKNRSLKNSKRPKITVVADSYCDICKCDNVYYSPICGTDERTYPNLCELDCESMRQNYSISVLSKGPCPKYFCDNIYSPVCGTDHITYDNECELRYYSYEGFDPNENLVGLYHYGPCQPNNCDCSYCPTDYEPVCGSDKQTYWNECWLNCVGDCSKQDGNGLIHFYGEGACYM